VRERERERERERKRVRKRERERERKRVRKRERERDVEYIFQMYRIVIFIKKNNSGPLNYIFYISLSLLFLTGMTGALAPFSYQVF
jgi:hypothetical protein